MRPAGVSRALVWLCLAGGMPCGGPSHASNGMNMIGFGPESISMGGADLATTASASAMNINPAGIAHCTETEVDVGLSPMWPSVRHRDQLGNDLDDSLDRYPMPFLGYVNPLERITLGIGLFVQGGMGAEYDGLTSPVSLMAANPMLPPGFFAGDLIPAAEQARTRVTFARLTPTVAWRAGPRWSLGASLNIGYARAGMRFLPDTSVMADLDMSGTEGDSPRDFVLGMNLEDTSAFGYGLRAGFQYRGEKLSVGSAYATETSLDLGGGTMNLNMSAMGLGNVRYDAEIDGFAWPQQLGLGLAYRISPSVMVAADADWVGWSGAIETLEIKMSNPDQPMAPPTRTIPFRMDWKDQWVWALGVEVTPAKGWAVRAGYNRGESPIPDDRLRLLFPAIAENHVTAGFGVERGPWAFDMGLEYVLEVTQTNNSTDPSVNPLGPGSSVELSQLFAHFLLRRRFGGL